LDEGKFARQFFVRKKLQPEKMALLLLAGDILPHSGDLFNMCLLTD
jgi:hypothetical protein